MYRRWVVMGFVVIYLIYIDRFNVNCKSISCISSELFLIILNYSFVGLFASMRFLLEFMGTLKLIRHLHLFSVSMLANTDTK